MTHSQQPINCFSALLPVQSQADVKAQWPHNEDLHPCRTKIGKIYQKMWMQIKTKRQTNTAFKCFCEYLTEKNLPLDFESYEDKHLDYVLA